MNHPVVLAALAEHLTLGELFRLDRALGRAPAWPMPETAALVAARTGRRFAGGGTTGLRLTLPRRRCIECGASCARTLCVCPACRRDPANFRSLVSRADLLALHRERPIKNLRRRVQRELRVVARGTGHRHLYWRHEALRTLYQN